MRTEHALHTNPLLSQRRLQSGTGELWQTVFSEALAEADEQEKQRQDRQRARLASGAALKGGRWSPRTYVTMMVDQHGDRLQAHIIDQDHDCLLRHIGEQELARMQRELEEYAGTARAGARCAVSH